MVMYNTQFKVKYYDIEQELLVKCEKNNESEYSKQDVLDICDKLYRDELLSVFLKNTNEEIDNINSDLNIDNINTNIEELYNTVLVKTQFKQLIEEVSDTCFSEYRLPKETNTYMILYALFSYQLFHVTHKCICQHLETGIIDITLFLQLKYLTTKLLSQSQIS